jgi:hypothetical protein
MGSDGLNRKRSENQTCFEKKSIHFKPVKESEHLKWHLLEIAESKKMFFKNCRIIHGGC